MEPQQLHSNTHTHDFSFYDLHRHEEIDRDQHTRESDLLNTIISFPSTSTPPVLLHRNSLQERSMSPGSSSFFLHSTSSATASLDAGASRDELQQLTSRDIRESNFAGREKLRTLLGMNSSRFQEEGILARFNTDTLGGGGAHAGARWHMCSDPTDINPGSASVPDDTLQVPMHLGAHNMLSTILPVHNDHGGGASYGHSRTEAMWGDDHSTELLLLPGISGAANNEHTHQHQQIIPHEQSGKALDLHSSDQDRQQNSSFSGLSSTYASASGGSLRDLSLSLSARENSQHVLFGARAGFLTGSTSSQLQTSVYLKTAQSALRDECRKAIAGGGGSLFTKGNTFYSNAGATGRSASAIACNELSFASGERAGTLVGNSISVHPQQLNVIRSSQHQHQHEHHHHHHHHQHQQQQQQQQQQLVPAAMAHLQLQDQYGRAQTYGLSGPGGQPLQPAVLMDRSQQLELKRRKLYIMLEELEKRFKKYEEHMQMLVIELETSGVGIMVEGAAPFKESAEQAVQSKFTYLRDAMIASESFSIMGGFSGHEAGAHQAVHVQGATAVAGESCDEVGAAAATRFRMLDQQLRHQRALQQVGLFPQPPWRPQRGLPERSVSLLRAWLFDHFLHPYPKDTEKVLLARQTGLTRNQVSNWFINARVRLWKPMVEEMYQEEMKTAELRRAAGQGNASKSTFSTSHTSRGATGTSEAHHFQVDQSKKHVQSDFDNHLIGMQDLSSINAMQGVETSRFFYKQSDFDNQERQCQPAHQDDQLSFVEVPTAKAAAMATVLEATHTWPFIQHQSASFDAQEQPQHYCSSDISTALMRFGSSGGVTLTLGLQQHSGAGGGGGGGSINCGGAPFERSPAGVDDVNAAHRWCE